MRTEDDLRTALAALAATASDTESKPELPAVLPSIGPRPRPKKWPATLAVAAAVAAIAIVVPLTAHHPRSTPAPAATATAVTSAPRPTSAPPTTQHSSPQTAKPTAKPSPTPTASSHRSTVPPATTPLQAPQYQQIGFRSADQQVLCGTLGDTKSTTEVFCGNGTKKFTTPVCTEGGQPGYAVFLNAAGDVTTTDCAGDLGVQYLSSQIVPYGTPVRLGLFTCTVTRGTTVTCTTAAGHGFSFSPTGLRKF